MTLSTEEIHDREEQALERRISGESYRKIGASLGYTNGSGAFKAIHRALRRLPLPDTTESRALELSRAEALWSKAWRKAEEADWAPGWFRVLIEISDRLCRLRGLMLPVNLNAGAPTTVIDLMTQPDFLRYLEANQPRPVRDVEALPGANGAPSPVESDPSTGEGATSDPPASEQLCIFCGGTGCFRCRRGGVK